MQFLINPNKINVLCSPQEYLNCIKKMIKTANQRLHMSSLYLGTGQYEHELINELQSLKRTNKTVQCSLIFDKCRSERIDHKNKQNSINLLKRLTDYSNTNIYLYHNPIIKGIALKCPNIMREMIGVFHTKIVISDDNILITGANFSQSYFINRSDRYYYLSNCKEIADYLTKYLHIISNLSYELKPNGKSYLPNQKQQLNPMYTGLLSSYSHKYHHIPMHYLPNDKVLFFLSNQLKHQQIINDEHNLNEFIKNKDCFNKIVIHSGYLNLSCSIKDQLISKIRNANIDIYTSSPQANSFYQGGHIKSIIPYMYRVYERELLNLKGKGRIRLFEYVKPKWTFHGKGLWFYSKNNNQPVITAIGSSNYNERGLKRDLETQFYFMSNNSLFISKLQEEVRKNRNHFEQITMEKIDNDKCVKLKRRHFAFARLCKGLL